MEQWLGGSLVDFPGGAVSGDIGLSPGPEDPTCVHVAEQLSPCATVT